MDDKEKELIRACYARIAAGDFVERDVFSLLILLRPHSKAHSAVYEFANFVAHREKDRGHIRDYLHQTKSKLDKLGQINTTLVIKPVFSVEQIGTSLNGALSQISLSPLDHSRIEQVVLCVISLLQHVRIVQKSAEIGRLIIGITKEDVILLGRVRVKNKAWAIFPALMVPNVYVSDAPSDTPIVIDDLLDVSVAGGTVSLNILKPH